MVTKDVRVEWEKEREQGGREQQWNILGQAPGFYTGKGDGEREGEGGKEERDRDNRKGRDNSLK